MKVAFVTFEYPPFIIGGAGVYARNITRQLAELGHHVVVFTPKVNDLQKEKSDIQNLKIIEVKTNKRLPFKALQFWLHLPDAVKKEGLFDIIHFNGISYWFLKKKLRKVPHVVTVHHLVRDAIESSSSRLVSRIRDIRGETGLFIPFIEKRCIKNADKIIAVSNFTKNQIIIVYSVSPRKIDVVYNGISLDGYSFTEKELEEARKELNLDEKPVLLFVGRVDDKRKGLDTLLKAFRIALEKIDAILLIVGGGDQSQARTLAQSLEIYENIVFAGFVDDLTLKKCYALCDAYVCPSRLEGFGLTILEAMAARKPIIATNVGAIPELLKNEENGILVELNDLDGLSNAISKFLQKEKNVECVGERLTLFSWEKSAKETEQLYMKLFSV